MAASSPANGGWNEGPDSWDAASAELYPWDEGSDSWIQPSDTRLSSAAHKSLISPPRGNAAKRIRLDSSSPDRRGGATRQPRSEQAVDLVDVTNISRLLLLTCDKLQSHSIASCVNRCECLHNLAAVHREGCPRGRAQGLDTLIAAIASDRLTLFQVTLGADTRPVTDAERFAIFSHAMLAADFSNNTITYRGVPLCIPAFLSVRGFTKSAFYKSRSGVSGVDRRLHHSLHKASSHLTAADHMVFWFRDLLTIIGEASVEDPNRVNIGRGPISHYFKTFRQQRPGVVEVDETVGPTKAQMDYFVKVITDAFISPTAESLDKYPGLPRVRPYPPEVGKCPECEQLIQQMGSAEPEVAAGACVRMRLHKQQVRTQAAWYARSKQLASLGLGISLGVDAINNRTTKLVWPPTGIDTDSIGCKRMSGWKITNAVLHPREGTSMQTLRLVAMPWVAPNANLQLTQLLDFILPSAMTRLTDPISGKRPDTGYVQFDRASDNHCRTGLAFWAWQIHKGLFHTLYLTINRQERPQISQM